MGFLWSYEPPKARLVRPFSRSYTRTENKRYPSPSAAAPVSGLSSLAGDVAAVAIIQHWKNTRHLLRLLITYFCSCSRVFFNFIRKSREFLITKTKTVSLIIFSLCIIGVLSRNNHVQDPHICSIKLTCLFGLPFCQGCVIIVLLFLFWW